MSLYTGGIDEGSGGGAGKWIVGFLLAIVFAAALGALTLYLLSAKEPARESHRRVVNALAEGDAVIVRDYESWTATAEASDPGTEIALPNWPVQLTVTREELLESTPESLRVLLLDRSADLLYEEGTAALRDPDAADDPGRFTASGIVDAFIDLLREDVHTASLITMVVLLVLSLAVALWLGALTRGYGRLMAVAIAVGVGALAVLAGGAALSAYMRVSLDDNAEYLREELLHIGEDLAMVPLLIGAAFAAAGAVLLIVGVLAARWSDSRRSSISLDRRLA